MNYRALGNTGIHVSEIGVGCGGLGASKMGDCQDALEYAFDAGVTLFDTADSYAGGQSETMLGNVFGDKPRDKIVYATKFGTVITPEKKSYKDVSVAHMKEALEGSLRRLKTDYIDIYQLHNPPMSFLDDEALIAALNALQDEGKIRCYGLSIDKTPDALSFLDRTRGKAIQIFLHLLAQKNRSPFLEEAEKRGAGVIVKVPMGCGCLTGKFSGDYPPPDDPRRKRWGEQNFHERVQAAEKVRPILETETRTMAQGALAWLLSFPQVSTVIPGISSLDKIKETVGAAGMRLTPAEMHALDTMENGRIRNAQYGW